MNIVINFLRRVASIGLLALLALPAFAANYTFPGALPAGCAGAGPNYTCGALTFGNTDVITIAAPRPATITVNGNLQANRATINQAGATSDLTITVNGTFGTGTNGIVNANLSATGNITLGNGTTIGGTLNGSGTVALGNNSTVSGALTGNSTINFGTGSSAPQCVRAVNASTITLGNNASAGSVCCGALGACSSACVTNNSGNAMPGICGGGTDPAIAGRFNAFETGTVAGSVTGVIKTKIAASAFSVAIAAIDTSGSALATSFAGTVKVEILDARDNSGALNSSTGCRASWVVATGTASTNLTFALSDQGRKNLSLTIVEAWKDNRLRISYPATGTATAVGCSNDNFAVRPSTLANLAARDSNFSAPDLTVNNTGRLLNLINNVNGNVHKAGQPFTVSATAQRATGATAANYTGTPTPYVGTCSGGSACYATLGALTFSTPITAAAGLIKNTTASYSEAGAFNLQLIDDTFAAVDASDGSTAIERNITSAMVSVGRFVPDHFELTLTNTPSIKPFSSACASPTFTYVGQPFGLSVPPQATLAAHNAAHGITANYPDSKLTALAVTPVYALQSTTPALAPLPAFSNSVAAGTITANGSNGTAAVVARTSDSMTIARSATVAPFAADITLAWTANDTEPGTGNGTIGVNPAATPTAIVFDGNNSTFRFGTLNLGGASGGELVRLGLALETQYWNGSAFVTNAADNCTQVPASALAMSNFRSNLAACETAPSTASLTLTGGRALLALQAPGSGNNGSVDLALNLGATATGQQCASVGAAATPAVAANMPWLQRLAPAGTYTANPTARASFGQYRSPVIHMREVY